MKKLFDETKGRLIFIGAKADPDYWDTHWSEGPNIEKASLEGSAVNCVRAFAAYLNPSDGPILEAGCGNGGPLLALTRQGYAVEGVDFAERTVRQLQNDNPELKVSVADVMAVPFENDAFAGYYSGGVIEHFWDGYEVILNESFRVLRPGGYAIYTFPVMSPIRRFKAAVGFYPGWSGTVEAPDGFYQFSLRAEAVADDLRNTGFYVVEVSMRSGVKGASEELGWLGKISKGRNLFSRAGRFFSRFAEKWIGHSVMVVAQKPTQSGTRD